MHLQISETTSAKYKDISRVFTLEKQTIFFTLERSPFNTH